MKKPSLYLLAPALALGLAAPAALAQPAELTGTWALDPAHATIGFEIDHLGLAEIHGRFNKFEGTITIGSESKIDVSIDTASIDTGVEKRDDHLRTPDFFDARQYPKITFTTKSAKFEGDELTVTGDFTMHGVTKELTIEFDVKGPKEMPSPNGPQTRIGLTGETVIKRSEFGINAAPGMLGEEVEIDLSVEAIKQ